MKWRSLYVLALGAAAWPTFAQEPASLALSPRHGPGARAEESARAKLPDLAQTATSSMTEGDGTLSWRALGDFGVIRHDNADGRYGRFVAYYAEPVVSEKVKSLAGATVRVRGYMLPRMGVEGSSRFLVSALPAADEDGCAAGGPGTFVDVIVEGPVSAAVDRIVTVEGRLSFFDRERWAGYLYRLNGARIVTEGAGN